MTGTARTGAGLGEAPALPLPGPDEPASLSATELSAAYGAHRITPSEALQSCLARIEAHDDAIRAFVTIDTTGAEAAAAASDRRHRDRTPLGLLDGVPIAVKDNIDVAGLATTAGHARFRARIPEIDAPVIAHLRAAGAVIVGKTNLHEGALGATTSNPHFGATENPLAPGFTPGGSSGGSGAAVAAHFVPIALGTDTMGSVRIPAAYCGVMGLKPTAGLVPRTGTAYLSWLLDTIGPIARTVDDLAETLRAIRSFDAADELSDRAPAGWSPFFEQRQDLSGITLGVPDNVTSAALEPAVAAAFRAGVDAVRVLGGEPVALTVTDWRPDMDRRAGLLVSEVEAAAELEATLSEGRNGFGEEFLALVDYGHRAPVTKVARAYRSIRRAGAAGRRALEAVDMLLMPTAPQVAFPHAGTAPDTQADFTALANFAGLPAVSVPVPTSGLPAGLQIVGRRFQEGRILAVAESLARLLAAEARQVADA